MNCHHPEAIERRRVGAGRRTGFRLEGEQRGRWSRFRTYLYSAAWSAAKDGL